MTEPEKGEENREENSSKVLKKFVLTKAGAGPKTERGGEDYPEKILKIRRKVCCEIINFVCKNRKQQYVTCEIRGCVV